MTLENEQRENSETQPWRSRSGGGRDGSKAPDSDVVAVDIASTRDHR